MSPVKTARYTGPHLPSARRESLPKCDVAEMRSTKVRFMRGFSNMTTGAEEGSFRSATHDVPDSVSNAKGPDFSIFTFTGTGLEIAHLFFFAHCLFLLQRHTTHMHSPTTTSAEAHDKAAIMLLGFCFDFCFSLGLFFSAWMWWDRSCGGVEVEADVQVAPSFGVLDAV